MNRQPEQQGVAKDVIRLINYTDLTQISSQLVLAMRNHPEIKKWMHNPKDISESEHDAFIETLKNTTSKQYFLVKRGETVIGTVNFTQIDYAAHSAELGLYANPFSALSGLGQILLETATLYAFKEQGLQLLKLEVYSHNQRAIKSYEKQGFERSALKVVNGTEIICMQKTRANQEVV